MTLDTESSGLRYPCHTLHIQASGQFYNLKEPPSSLVLILTAWVSCFIKIPKQQGLPTNSHAVRNSTKLKSYTWASQRWTVYWGQGWVSVNPEALEEALWFPAVTVWHAVRLWMSHPTLQLFLVLNCTSTSKTKKLHSICELLTRSLSFLYLYW